MSSIKMCSHRVQFSFNVPIDLSNDVFEFETSDIVIDEVPWKIRLRRITTPTGKKCGDGGLVDVCLICNYKEDHEDSKWFIEAAAIVRLLTYGKNKMYIQQNIPTMQFDNVNVSSDPRNLILWNDLVDEDNHCIGKNKIVRFEAMIITTPVRQLDDIIVEIHSVGFGMVLKDVESLEFIRTPKVILRDSEWFLKFEKMDEWLAVTLFKAFDSEHFGWSYQVNLTVKLLSQFRGTENVHFKLNQRFTTTSNGVGWSKFISWERLMDPKNGYVENRNAWFNIVIDVSPKEPFWKPME